MESFGRTLLYNIAVDINKPTHTMNELADILEANYCDTQEALSSIGVDDLKMMGIPPFIALKLTKAIEQINGVGEHGKVIPSKDKKKKIKKEAPKESKKDKILLAALKMKMQGICEGYLDPQEKIDSLRLVKKILLNIVNNPTEEKFRSLKMSNQTLHMKLWRYFYMIDFFALLYFKHNKETDMVQLPGDKIHIDTLRLGLEVVEEEINKAMMEPVIDHYSAGFSSNNPNFNVQKIGQMSGYEQSKYSEALKKLKEDREKLIKEHQVKQQIRFYKKSNNQMAYKLSSYNDNEKESEKMELNMFKRRVIEFQNSFKNDIAFSNRSKKEFEEFLKKPLHLDTIARIKMPNGDILESNFASNAPIDSIFELLDKFLLNKAGYFLYIAPGTKNRISQEDKQVCAKRFCDLGFTPNVVLNFSYHQDSFNKVKDFVNIQK